MTNIKIQEALNYICTFISSMKGRGIGKQSTLLKLDESIKILQKLVNINKELNETCDILDSFNDRLVEENKKLEKKLDIACEVLSSGSDWFAKQDKERIKETLSKESEKK
ncbi:MAG: hypothetical protein KBT03_07660 [Bacteroidales bacterium]|nr:hypothetical protein [Candidatus Scybalousia scybalohippi]